jgi:uroporphyrin-III C-methyltransferase
MTAGGAYVRVEAPGRHPGAPEGREGSGTTAALVERATWPDARAAEGTLDTIVDVRDSRGIEPPGVTVIGRVAASLEQVRAFLADDPDREAET